MTELMERQGWQPLTRNIEQGKSPILCDSMKIGKILDSKSAQFNIVKFCLKFPILTRPMPFS